MIIATGGDMLQTSIPQTMELPPPDPPTLLILPEHTLLFPEVCEGGVKMVHCLADHSIAKTYARLAPARRDAMQIDSTNITGKLQAYGTYLVTLADIPASNTPALEFDWRDLTPTTLTREMAHCWFNAGSLWVKLGTITSCESQNTVTLRDYLCRAAYCYDCAAAKLDNTTPSGGTNYPWFTKKTTTALRNLCLTQAQCCRYQEACKLPIANASQRHELLKRVAATAEQHAITISASTLKHLYASEYIHAFQAACTAAACYHEAVYCRLQGKVDATAYGREVAYLQRAHAVLVATSRGGSSSSDDCIAFSSAETTNSNTAEIVPKEEETGLLARFGALLSTPSAPLPTAKLTSTVHLGKTLRHCHRAFFQKILTESKTRNDSVYRAPVPPISSLPLPQAIDAATSPELSRFCVKLHEAFPDAMPVCINNDNILLMTQGGVRGRVIVDRDLRLRNLLADPIHHHRHMLPSNAREALAEADKLTKAILASNMINALPERIFDQAEQFYTLLADRHTSHLAT